MLVQVRVPTALRQATGGTARVQVEASDVATALEGLEAACPALKVVLRDEAGALRPQVSIYVNDRHVRYLQGIETPLQKGDEVYVVPIVMGG
jgi:molybdopterin synthase sulfur carrier subunit